ncbi:hypothetical protein EC973_000927 [Apophysomyces ossiformis]|uniref:Uncharacterized protein n=1 Tax=Apophysomyces ossiformis TaxID=679940 RepID=A0A8H7BQZ9_9FUNG|nr:hypothetical protein EC973_000927 [Apophysomyces ossiformis]
MSSYNDDLEGELFWLMQEDLSDDLYLPADTPQGFQTRHSLQTQKRGLEERQCRAFSRLISRYAEEVETLKSRISRQTDRDRLPWDDQHGLLEMIEGQEFLEIANDELIELSFISDRDLCASQQPVSAAIGREHMTDRSNTYRNQLESALNDAMSSLAKKYERLFNCMQASFRKDLDSVTHNLSMIPSTEAINEAETVNPIATPSSTSFYPPIPAQSIFLPSPGLPTNGPTGYPTLRSLGAMVINSQHTSAGSHHGLHPFVNNPTRHSIQSHQTSKPSSSTMHSYERSLTMKQRTFPTSVSYRSDVQPVDGPRRQPIPGITSDSIPKHGLQSQQPETQQRAPPSVIASGPSEAPRTLSPKALRRRRKKMSMVDRGKLSVVVNKTHGPQLLCRTEDQRIELGRPEDYDDAYTVYMTSNKRFKPNTYEVLVDDNRPVYIKPGFRDGPHFIRRKDGREINVGPVAAVQPTISQYFLQRSSRADQL